MTPIDRAPYSGRRPSPRWPLFVAGVLTGAAVALAAVAARGEEPEAPNCELAINRKLAPPTTPQAPRPPHWTPAAEARARALWPTLSAAAGLEDVPPDLLVAVAAWETEVRSIRGGRGNRHWGLGQVACPLHLRDLRRHLDAPGLTCSDLLRPDFGLAAGAFVLAGALRSARGDVVLGLCRYSGSSVADGGCRYAAAVLWARVGVRRDLGDLVREEV